VWEIWGVKGWDICVRVFGSGINKKGRGTYFERSLLYLLLQPFFISPARL